MSTSFRLPVAGFVLAWTVSSMSAWAQKLEMPFRFEENRGQLSSSAKFIARAAGYSAEMQPDQVTFHGGGTPVQMRFADGRTDAQVQPSELMSAPTDAYDGRTGRFYNHLKNYEKLTYAGVYSGVDVVFRGAGRSLEFDFALKPHADYKSIGLDFSGQTELKIEGDGSLVLGTQRGELRLLPPDVYQEING